MVMGARADNRLDLSDQSGANAGAAYPIVAIGASAGGLDAIAKLLDKLDGVSGIAFLLVQHLDPTHESLLVDLLTRHTKMTVVQAMDGLEILPDHLYIIPPGRYLSVQSNMLRVSEPDARHGARLPFDALLNSLASSFGARAACVILTGTGTDGSLALAGFKDRGGHIIVQDPREAEFDGMPKNAIQTGLVDEILPLAKIPHAIKRFAEARRGPAKTGGTGAGKAIGLADIIAYLRDTTPHDFRQYKAGTLSRRVARRMDLTGIKAGDFPAYLALMESDPAETKRLISDLLINVTSFFRDPHVFDYLETEVVPKMLANLAQDEPLRIWVAGCSTGEEAYSLAMICHDAMTAFGREVKLQIFASDLDGDAISTAREGFYPASVAADMTADRLARYFIKDDGGYRACQSLRNDIVFTVQNLLTDPPFSRINLISCRNLMIYLKPDAQAKVISLFDFALRDEGVLLLGTSETVPKSDNRFTLVAKAERIYHHVAKRRGASRGFPMSFGPADLKAGGATVLTPSRQASLAELCRRAVLENHAPAAILADQNGQCLYSLGPTDRYLRVVPGYPSLDLLAMATPVVRTKLRQALKQVSKTSPHVSTSRSRLTRDGKTFWFTIHVHYVDYEETALSLVCFLEEAQPEEFGTPVRSRGEMARIAELERELEETQRELQATTQAQEIAAQEQKAINEEALSANEEFQSTNEELLTSKEELQSLNEELTALNSQLQESLDRQRTTADDLENVLYTTNMATLFLDRDLKIRFFTPATRSLFNLIPGDIGRPMADLHPLSSDANLLDDADIVLKQHTTIERELQPADGTWFVRRILPYSAHDSSVEGVVITFQNITDRKKALEAVELGRQQAERANIAKSRFLASASHDLRQPLQSLRLIQELLAMTVADEKSIRLVERLDATLATMGEMLDVLLDINQIEAGIIAPKPERFPINMILTRLSEECQIAAQARDVTLHFVPSTKWVESDPHLLEQMVRNILSNAIKYTAHGKILIGCRPRGGLVRIEIWDTGLGIAEDQLEAIFEEFHQVNNSARERSQGLGLGLSIVQRLAQLLNHPVQVRSSLGKGSIFSIDVPATPHVTPQVARPKRSEKAAALRQLAPGHKVLLIEDDPDVLALLDQLLTRKGSIVRTAIDARSAEQLVGTEGFRPDIIIADHNLPGEVTGLDSVSALRTLIGQDVPSIILTGDITAATLSDIASQKCVHLNKPVKSSALLAEMTKLLQAKTAE
ncbi:MAG: chemotaxis protein CheB [Sphingomonadaceae bacterium]|jgi:two-component system CheB/CheR fusion protein